MLRMASTVVLDHASSQCSAHAQVQRVHHGIMSLCDRFRRPGCHILRRSLQSLRPCRGMTRFGSAGSSAGMSRRVPAFRHRQRPSVPGGTMSLGCFAKPVVDACARCAATLSNTEVPPIPGRLREIWHLAPLVVGSRTACEHSLSLPHRCFFELRDYSCEEASAAMGVWPACS